LKTVGIILKRLWKDVYWILAVEAEGNWQTRQEIF
jgi:hypothetical protein